jgi:hypothetical protein
MGAWLMIDRPICALSARRGARVVIVKRLTTRYGKRASCCFRPRG